MKTLLGYFRKHFQDDFNWQLHFAVLLFALACVAANYFVPWAELFGVVRIEGNFEDDILDGIFRGKLIYFLLFFLLYSFAYYGTIGIYVAFTRDFEWLRQRNFWIISAAGLMILSWDIGFYWEASLAKLVFPPQLFYFGARALDRFISIFTSLLPLFILWRWTRTPKTDFYGLTLKGSTLKPYFMMIGLMLPLLIWASFQPDFLRQYPTYRDYGATAFLGVPEAVTVFIYEFCYGIDFISVELFFRGFLVIGMVGLMGKKSILPMAVLYCFVHFGKPLGEAVSSFFGGYILGVLAFYTRNIFGGIIVHLGIAWLMELLAFIQLFEKWE